MIYRFSLSLRNADDAKKKPNKLFALFVAEHSQGYINTNTSLSLFISTHLRYIHFFVLLHSTCCWLRCKHKTTLDDYLKNDLKTDDENTSAYFVRMLCRARGVGVCSNCAECCDAIVQSAVQSAVWCLFALLCMPDGRSELRDDLWKMRTPNTFCSEIIDLCVARPKTN